MADKDRSRTRSKTLPVGTPAAITGGGEPEIRESDIESEDREANLLPPELPTQERQEREEKAEESRRTKALNSKTLRLFSGSLPPEARRSTTSDAGPRISRMSRLSQIAGFDQRTSLAELAGATNRVVNRLTAERLTFERLTQVRVGYRVTAGAVGAALFLLVLALAVSVGQWRWVPLGLMFLLMTALVGYTTMRSLLPRLAHRFGDVRLPGRVGMYLALVGSTVASVGGVVTWGVSRGSVFVGRNVLPSIAPYIPVPLPPTAKPLESEPPKPLQVVKMDGNVWVRPGKLYVPSTFQPKDGKFDLLLHFHGNGDLVHESVVAADLNVLVHVTNLGDGSGLYESRFAIPGALDDLVKRIEDKASAKAETELKVDRIALSSWSAGYGSLSAILARADNVERVDAVLVLDGIHGGFQGSGRVVHPLAIASFVGFAEKAVAGTKLMMITHSSIPTSEYCSSTESADALLSAVGATRSEVDASAQPPHVTFPLAVSAFPSKERRWLTVKSAAHAGNFHVLGCTGDGKGDHIAHLAQMSVTVLPELKKRWQ